MSDIDKFIDVLHATVEGSSKRSKKITDPATRHLITIEKLSTIIDCAVSRLLCGDEDLTGDKITQVRETQQRLDEMLEEMSLWIQEKR